MGAECSIDLTVDPNRPREPATKPPHERVKGLNVKAGCLAEDLVTHEVECQEILKALEREEGKLNERRKRAGGSVAKSKKLVEDTFELDALKKFNELRIKYHRMNAKNPNLKKRSPSLEASTVIAKRLGKSDIMHEDFKRNWHTSTGWANCKLRSRERELLIRASCQIHGLSKQSKLGRKVLFQQRKVDLLTGYGVLS